MTSYYVITKWFEKVFAGVCSRSRHWSVVRKLPIAAQKETALVVAAAADVVVLVALALLILSPTIPV